MNGKANNFSLSIDAGFIFQSDLVAQFYLNDDMKKNENCRLTVSKPLPGSTPYSWIFQKNSVLKKSFDEKYFYNIYNFEIDNIF